MYPCVNAGLYVGHAASIHTYICHLEKCLHLFQTSSAEHIWPSTQFCDSGRQRKRVLQGRAIASANAKMSPLLWNDAQDAPGKDTEVAHSCTTGASSSCGMHCPYYVTESSLVLWILVVSNTPGRSLRRLSAFSAQVGDSRTLRVHPDPSHYDEDWSDYVRIVHPLVW